MASQPRPQSQDLGPASRPVASAHPVAITSRPWLECTSDAGFLADWKQLAQNCCEPNPFHEPWALLPALREHDPASRSQLLVCRAGDLLIGIVPLVSSMRYYRYPLPNLQNWTHDNAFCGGPLVRTGQEDRFWAALLDWADKHAGRALFLHLSHLAEDGPLCAALLTSASSQGRPVAIVHREERAFLRSDLSPDDYLAASMSGKKRKELRRQHRRLAEEGELTFERKIDDRGLSRWTEDFLTLEKAGWKGKNGSALACDPATESLFRSTLEGASNAGKLERLTMLMNGCPIAMLANFLSPPGAFSYKTAYDERYARFSPGVLLQRENLKVLGNPEIRWSDSCASANHPMIDRIWREKRSMVRVSAAIGGKARQALCRQILRREAPTEMEGN